MADQEETGTPAEGSAPPRQTPFKPAAAPDAAPAAGSSPVSPLLRRPTLRRPGEPAAAVPAAIPAPSAPASENPSFGVPITHTEAAKRKTTRVDLPLTANLTGTTDDTAEFKTVKLRPMPPPQPGAAPLPEGTKPLSPSQVEATKSKTSRISLEAALGANEGLDAGAPKTIRLKRPSELKSGATGQIAIPMATAATLRKTGLVPPAAGLPQQSMTARLPTQALPPDVAAPAAETEEASPTRRKTIKIKRPSVSTGIKINVGQQAAGDGEASDTEDMQQLSLPPGMQPIGVPDTVNPVFVVAAAVALLLTLGLVWILAAQTFGPNAAITGYTAMKGPDIAPPPGLVSIR